DPERPDWTKLDCTVKITLNQTKQDHQGYKTEWDQTRPFEMDQGRASGGQKGVLDF
ncbi:hypothetical protein HMI56_003773, partial [Coelomomyces lativittatus]